MTRWNHGAAPGTAGENSGLECEVVLRSFMYRASHGNAGFTDILCEEGRRFLMQVSAGS